MKLDEFDGVVRKLRSLCEDTLGDTTLMDRKLALIAELKPNVTPLTLPTGFGDAMDRLVEDASQHAQHVVHSLTETQVVYLHNVKALEKDLIAMQAEIARQRGR